MFSLLFPIGFCFVFMFVFLAIDSKLSKKYETLEDKIYCRLSNMRGPIYWDYMLIKKLASKLNVKDSIDISACLHTLERKGRIQKSYQDNRRCIIVKSLQEFKDSERMTTFVIVDGRLYMRKDSSDSWSVHDEWILRLGTD